MSFEDLHKIDLKSSLKWLKGIVSNRLTKSDNKKFELPDLPHFKSSSFIIKGHLAPLLSDQTVFAVFLLALAPHFQPNFFNQIMAEHLPEGGDFPEFGGVKSGNHRGMLPTGETALFVLAGNDLEKRLEIQQLFSSEHWFAKKHILWLEPVKEGEPAMSGKIVIDPEVIELLTTGNISKPRFSTDFPAEYIETEMEWEDLILHESTRRQIREIENWINYNETLMKDEAMRKRVKPGYRVLFYGPPGTGKTLTATLLGKQTGKDVFRIDLSRVISKYIGETEKNLSRLFREAYRHPRCPR